MWAVSAVSGRRGSTAGRDARGHRDRDPREAPSAAERSLSRLRFDLHDGPQQDVILLAEELRMFRVQLAGVIPDPSIRDRVLGGRRRSCMVGGSHPHSSLGRKQPS
jgi:hypothetical protein